MAGTRGAWRAGGGMRRGTREAPPANPEAEGHPRGRLSGLRIQVHTPCDHTRPRKDILPRAQDRKSASSEARCLASQHAVSAFCEGVG